MKQYKKQLSLNSFLSSFPKHIFFILLFAVIGVGAGFAYSYTQLKNDYYATAKIGSTLATDNELMKIASFSANSDVVVKNTVTNLKKKTVVNSDGTNITFSQILNGYKTEIIPAEAKIFVSFVNANYEIVVDVVNELAKEMVANINNLDPSTLNFRVSQQATNAETSGFVPLVGALVGFGIGFSFLGWLIAAGIDFHYDKVFSPHDIEEFGLNAHSVYLVKETKDEE